MARVLAFTLLVAALVSPFVVMVGGAPMVFLSWVLGFAAFAALRGDARVRRPATAALVVLGLVIVAGLIGAGITLGRAGTAVAATPALDPTSVLMSLAIGADWCAATVFLVVLEMPQRRLRALGGSALLALGVVSLVGSEIKRLGLAGHAPFAVSGGATSFVMELGGGLLVASLVRAGRDFFARGPALVAP